jgi:hypothetical protein
LLGGAEVARLGFGAMRITGSGVWGPPPWPSTSQVALAWLLNGFPALLAIPGSSKVAQLEENVAAAELVLLADLMGERPRGAAGLRPIGTGQREPTHTHRWPSVIWLTAGAHSLLRRQRTHLHLA